MEAVISSFMQWRKWKWIIGQVWGCPPFEVLNVNMDKDPIQTSEDLFAQIFEVAEKWYIAAASKRPQVIFSASPLKSTARSIYSNGTYFSLLLSTISSCALKCQDIQQHIWWYRVTKPSQNYFTNGKRRWVVTKSQEGKINHFYYSGIHRTIRCNDLSLPNKRSAASQVCLDTELQRCSLEKEDTRKKKSTWKAYFLCTWITKKGRKTT